MRQCVIDYETMCIALDENEAITKKQNDLTIESITKMELGTTKNKNKIKIDVQKFQKI